MINIKQLYKNYDKLNVLENLNFSAKAGDIVGVIGDSGSGKSTLLKIIAGLEAKTSGDITIDGSLGVVFQDFRLFPHMTVMENICYTPVKVHKQNKTSVSEHAEKILQQLSLSEYKNHRPSQLSGGQKQRVAIARTIINNPDIVLFDEPTSALDGNSVSNIASIITNLHDKNKLFIIISHDLNFIQEVATKILLLKGKGIEKYCTKDEYFA